MSGFTSKQSIEGQITVELGFEYHGKNGDVRILDEKPKVKEKTKIVSFKLTTTMPDGEMHEKTFWVTNWNKVERAGLIARHERIV